MNDAKIDQLTSRVGRVWQSFILLVSACVGLCAGTWIVHAEAASFPIPPAPALLQQVVSTLQQAPALAEQRALPTPQTVETTKYLSAWIEEEVPDIAVDEERTTFHSLNSDEERRQFIEAFWLRRDPTPNTLDNEFKNEYYRRIALANQRYGLKSGVPGQQTDRGRILMKFGQPDEIETHAQGSTFYAGDGNRPFVPPFGDGTGPIVQTVPFERWRYRSITGIGNNVILEFLDTARDGNYQLSTDSPEWDLLRHP
jgi:GWxTD domain-containing protein